MAAEQGDPYGQRNLGWAYGSGLGTEQDPEKAVKWYRKAAKQGNAKALEDLGEAYYYGEGVEKNIIKAYAYYALAYSYGESHAEIRMYLIEEKMTPSQVKEALTLSLNILADDL